MWWGFKIGTSVQKWGLGRGQNRKPVQNWMKRRIQNTKDVQKRGEWYKIGNMCKNRVGESTKYETCAKKVWRGEYKIGNLCKMLCGRV